jgi:hypothetical protein
MGDFLLCAQIEYFRLIDTEFDIAGPHVRMMWQKNSFAEVDRGLHVRPIKNLKEYQKIKKVCFFSPTQPTRTPPPPVIHAASQPYGEVVADDLPGKRRLPPRIPPPPLKNSGRCECRARELVAARGRGGQDREREGAGPTTSWRHGRALARDEPTAPTAPVNSVGAMVVGWVGKKVRNFFL